MSRLLPGSPKGMTSWIGHGSVNVSWRLMKEVPGVGMVTTGDAGSELFIHSPYKIKVGERLAYWALAQTYGRKGFQYSGPVYKTYRIQGNAVEIDFEYGEEGLTRKIRM